MPLRHLIVWALALSLAVGASAQELLKGGNMEDPTAWKVHHLDSEDITEYEFNYTAATPAAGQGGCLYAVATVIQVTNILFYQELTLIGGETYRVNGAFRDLTHGNLQNFWCEILLSTEVPPDSGVKADYGGGTPLVAFNTWDGCGSGVDGTFQDDYCKGSGPVFVCPGEPGQAYPYCFSLNIGVWSGGSQQIDFEVLVDELSLVHLGETGVLSRSHAPTGFTLYPNFPNPFNPNTEIRFTLGGDAPVQIHIYDASGRMVHSLVDGTLTGGLYRLSWDGKDHSGATLPAGIYLCRMRSGEKIQVHKMILAR